MHSKPRSIELGTAPAHLDDDGWARCESHPQLVEESA